MNTFVLHAALVCLAIASSVNGKVSKMDRVNINDLQDTSKNQIEDPQEETLMDKCKKNSRLDSSFETIQKNMKQSYNCMEHHNITALLKQIYQRKSENENIVLFKSLCKKFGDWHRCASNLTSSLMECLDDGEKIFTSTVEYVSTIIESFGCENDGERITTFYSDGGQKCFSDKWFGIKKCTEKFMSKKYMPKVQANGYRIQFHQLGSYIKFNEEQCSDLSELKSCIVDELKQCDKPTTANLIQTIFELALHNTPCTKFTTA